MKRKVLFIVLVLCTGLFSQSLIAQKNGDILLTVADKEISSEEFLAVYKKNNQDNMVLDKKSMKEYLELYINLKLKVAEAEARGMDTVPSFVNELEGYRKQLAKPYLIDEEVNKHLLEEAFERKQHDIRASHILIKCDENAKPEDSLRAYNRAMMVYEKAIKGEDFGDLAVKFSEDPSAKDRNTYGRVTKGNRGDLSYFSVFHMVYPFEEAAYNTPVGEISKPIRTSFGYHIVKVFKKVDAIGRIQLAHVLCMVKPNSNSEDSLKYFEEINEAMDRLNAGEDFNEIVLDYSDDQGTVNRGGILPWFTANRLFPSFYDEVKDLQIGQYSQIIETQYGYHILKVMDRKEIGTFEENKESLKRKITKSDRADLSRESLIKKIKKEYSFSENKEEIYTLETIIDNSVFLEGWKADKAAGMMNFLAQIGDKKYTVADFAKFIEETQIKDKPIAIKTFIEKKYDNFVEKICVDFEDGQLENKYEDFRILMQEYYDGILLFELKNELIWEKAIADTAGLEQYHEKNKENYMWKERIEVIEFTMTDRSLTDKVLELAQQDVAYDSIVKLVSALGSRSVLTSHKTYEEGDDKFIDSFKWEEGITEVKDKDGKNVFLKIVKHMEPQPKKLNEAKGLITADYQDYLEKVWEKELREKYSVKINKKAFKRLRKK